MSIDHISDASLSAEQNSTFMDVIGESLQLNQRSQLFNWLQGGFQYLIGHDVMIFGARTGINEPFQFEYFTSTRYFDSQQFNQVTNLDTGLMYKVVHHWEKELMPVVITHLHEAEKTKYFSVLRMDEIELKVSELGNCIAHGFDGGSSFVLFGRLHKAPSAGQARILEMMMPHLHCALIRVGHKKGDRYSMVLKTPNKKLTGRESEILKWVHMGKTNWEISTILNISPLTVKNHVQNIIRKLDVQNRQQAALKSVKLGLIKP